jgi:hypothetical protein
VVQLAVGAYGWWKARERSTSLITMIQANGGNLTSSVSFNRARYFTLCQASEARGIAWHDGRIESISLPQVATGCAGDPGLICLRAITTALLALFSNETTTSVLTYVIPHCLVNYDLEGQIIAESGPFLACVRQFVTAVATEEHCNTLTKRLQGRVDEGYRKLFSDSVGHFDFNDVQQVEVPMIIGVIEWTLTAPFKRRSRCYPTRSLAAWSIAFLLSELGFDVHCSPLIISSNALYDQQINRYSGASSNVFLVTHSSCETDPLASIPNRPSFSKIRSSFAARVVPITAVPVVIFRKMLFDDVHRTGGIINVDVQELCTIWKDTFEYVSSCFDPCHIADEFDKDSELPIVVLPVRTTYHPSAGNVFFQMLAPMLRKYLPSHDWTPLHLDHIRHVAWSLALEQRGSNPRFKLEDWYRFTAVLVASMYAVSCKSISPESSEDEPTAIGLIEVAAYSDFLSPHTGTSNLINWFTKFMNVDGSPSTNLLNWRRFLYCVFAGKQYLGYPDRLLEEAFGCYMNGVLVVSDILVRPSIHSNSLSRFHVHFGRPIQIPLGEDGLVLTAPAGENDIPMRPLPLARHQNVTELTSHSSETRARIDIEPFWEVEHEKVIFRLRLDGVVKCSFSPQKLQHAFSKHHNHGKSLLRHPVCKCNAPVANISVPASQRWKALEARQFLDLCTTNKDASTNLSAGKNEDSVCVHAGGDDAAQVLSLIVFRQPIVFASECLKCAFDYSNSHSKEILDTRPLPYNPQEEGIGIIMFDVITMPP